MNTLKLNTAYFKRYFCLFTKFNFDFRNDTLFQKWRNKMKKLSLSLFVLCFSLPTFACDEEFGIGNPYSTGYYLKNGKLKRSQVQRCSTGVQMQSYTFENGVMVNVMNINLAMRDGGDANGYETSVDINGKDAVLAKRPKGLPKQFGGECYQVKGSKQVYCF